MRKLLTLSFCCVAANVSIAATIKQNNLQDNLQMTQNTPAPNVLVDTASYDLYKHPFYAGISGGYGSTTWFGLVPPKKKRNDAILLSTPSATKEGGGVWGAFVGYEIIPMFAVEASYNRYPDATIIFDESSLFAFDHDGALSFKSHTEAFSVIGKLMLPIPHTQIRAFSGAGIADVHRWDSLKESWRVSPTFAFGFNYNFTDRIMGEIGFNYTGGYGQSELTPSDDFVPFLYSGYLRLAYRFG